MSTTLQADEKGHLHLPATLLPGAAPGAVYRVEAQSGVVVISPEAAISAEARACSPEEKVKWLHTKLKEWGTPVGLSDYAVSRDSIYD